MAVFGATNSLQRSVSVPRRGSTRTVASIGVPDYGTATSRPPCDDRMSLVAQSILRRDLVHRGGNGDWPSSSSRDGSARLQRPVAVHSFTWLLESFSLSSCPVDVALDSQPSLKNAPYKRRGSKSQQSWPSSSESLSAWDLDCIKLA